MFEYWKYNSDKNDNSEKEDSEIENEDLIFNKEISIPNDFNQYYELTVGFGLPKDKNS